MSQPQRPNAPSPGGDEHRLLIAHLRHELRNSLTAVIGYSEDLLESTSGPEALQLDLRALREAGQAVLGCVNEHLGADAVRELTADALPRVMRELGAACEAPASAISPLCARLVAAAETAGRYALIPTLCRIQAAGVMLNDMLAGYAIELPPRALWSDLPRGTGAAQGSTAGEVLAPVTGRLLVVDDNSITRDVLRQWLERQGYHVDEASGGDPALDLIRARDYDVILLDLVMPDRSGVDVLDVLRAEGRLGRAPIIMISAVDELDALVNAIEHGADDYVLKPFQMVLLRARIRMALELRRHRERERAYEAMLAEIRGGGQG